MPVAPDGKYHLTGPFTKEVAYPPVMLVVGVLVTDKT